MSDLFHKDVPPAFIDDVFNTMERVDRHVYQVLTKRSSRMRDYLPGALRLSAGPETYVVWGVRRRPAGQREGEASTRGSCQTQAHRSSYASHKWYDLPQRAYHSHTLFPFCPLLLTAIYLSWSGMSSHPRRHPSISWRPRAAVAIQSVQSSPGPVFVPG